MSIQHIIRGAPLFHDLYEDEINIILKNCNIMQLEPGVKIFDEGDRGEDLYLFLGGKVDIIKGNVIIATLGKVELFGELILLYEGINMYDKNPTSNEYHDAQSLPSSR